MEKPKWDGFVHSEDLGLYGDHVCQLALLLENTIDMPRVIAQIVSQYVGLLNSKTLHEYVNGIIEKATYDKLNPNNTYKLFMVKNNKIQEIDTFNYHNFKENCVNFINENWNRKLRLRCSNNNATIEMLEKRDMNRRREGWYTPYTWVSKKVFYNGLREEYELLFLEGVKYPHITSRYEIIQPNNPEILEFSNMGIIEILN